ncbi:MULTISPECIES: hypothetical protein [Bradyrhizobium]|uniref:hypothetical protein n=1 Tax=Bradyrhizobium TaxID=374 RepID=UPI00114CF610|nr:MULTISPECIES: hypothetical protein [Bradyrhizobium]MCA1543538.1 hypothetical protein [Bradyrhizobium sp. NBAIM32]
MQGALILTASSLYVQVDLLKKLADSKTPFGVVTCHLDVAEQSWSKSFDEESKMLDHFRTPASSDGSVSARTSDKYDRPQNNRNWTAAPTERLSYTGFGNARGDAQRIAVDDLDEILATPRVLAIGMFQTCQQRRR